MCTAGVGQKVTSVPQFPHQQKQEMTPYAVAARRGLTAAPLRIA